MDGGQLIGILVLSDRGGYFHGDLCASVLDILQFDNLRADCKPSCLPRRWSEEAHSLDGACTNWAEEFFSRMRRAEIGHHHHVAGPYLLRFAQEAAWREDNRRLSNGEQVNRVAGLALTHKPSVDFSGYWQRHVVK
jgi:hypothetical protein